MHSAARPLLVLALFLSLVHGRLPAADPALVNMSRPDVNFVMGIDVSQIATSPLVGAALVEAQKTKPDWDALFGLLGPNPFRYLDEIVISAKLDPASESKKPKKMLIVARGLFGDGGFRNLICGRGCEPEQYRDFEMLRLAANNGEKPSYFTFLDSEYAVMGPAEEVQGAIDRQVAETHSVFNPTIQDGIERLGNHHIWLSAKGSWQDSANADQEGAGQLAGLAASKIEGFGLGLTLGQDVEVAFELQSHTPENAQQLFEMAQGFLAMMKAGEAEPETKQMLEQLSLTHEGSRLAASLRIPEAQIRQQLHERAAKHREQVAVEAAAPPPSRPRREGGIRIYGLEEEPVEVPTHQR